MKALVIQTTQDLARTAYEQHHIQWCTNAVLDRPGNSDLTRPELLGAAVTGRFRR